MRALERLLFIVILIVSTPVMLLWFAVPAFAGLFIGLPIAGIKFVLTGSSGIDWYVDTVLDYVTMNWPVFNWLDAIEKRKIASQPPTPEKERGK